jgi:serine phosphatase RsbU (regulator of sigma subunit)
MDTFVIIKDWAQTITAGGVIGALLISFFSFISQRRHSNYERLVEVYKMINDFEQREARKSIYRAYRIYTERYYNDGLKIGVRPILPRICQHTKATSSLMFSEIQKF